MWKNTGTVIATNKQNRTFTVKMNSGEFLKKQETFTAYWERLTQYFLRKRKRKKTRSNSKSRIKEIQKRTVNTKNKILKGFCVKINNNKLLKINNNDIWTKGGAASVSNY